MTSTCQNLSSLSILFFTFNILVFITFIMNIVLKILSKLLCKITCCNNKCMNIEKENKNELIEIEIELKDVLQISEV